MFVRSASDIVSALQTAVGPMILISGMGVLLMAMTNRLGRAIDRARSLSSSDAQNQPEVKTQLNVMILRAEFLRRGILLAMTSALCAALQVIVIFIVVLLEKNLSVLIAALFILGMAALIAALIYFMRDVNLSLAALYAKLKNQPRA